MLPILRISEGFLPRRGQDAQPPHSRIGQGGGGVDYCRDNSRPFRHHHRRTDEDGRIIVRPPDRLCACRGRLGAAQPHAWRGSDRAALVSDLSFPAAGLEPRLTAIIGPAYRGRRSTWPAATPL